jgi:dTDP-4-dehydrorhamnose reductase
MTVLIAGAHGRLGRALVDAFASHTTVALSRDALDVTDEAAVNDVVRSVAPALVVNAAARTDVDACEADPLDAHRVHAIGPWWLARACAAVDATLVTVSTDYVFGAEMPVGPDGEPRPFEAHDPVAPINAYGRSKAAGEQLVRETLPAHHIVRTAWLFGGRAGGFVDAMLDQPDGARVQVVDDQVGCPTFVHDLAASIRELAVGGRYGTWHRTSSGWCSRAELARELFGLLGRDVEIEPVASDAMPRPAPRPQWSVLGDLHARAAGLTPLARWQDALRRFVDGGDA